MIAEEPILGGIFTTKIALYSFEVLVVAVVIAIGYKKIIYKQS